MEANKTDATIINRIIERKILICKESIDILKPFSIVVSCQLQLNTAA
jgi:hypothetical protein